MKQLLQTIKDRLLAGQPLVLATVVGATGSTPRGAGARMVVGREGRLCGTIGGGAIEHRCLELAQQVFADGKCREEEFVLTQQDLQKLGMICGGSARVFLQVLPGWDAHTVQVMDDALSALHQGGELWLVSDVNADGKLSVYRRKDAPEWLLPWLTRRPVRVQEGERNCFVEQIGTAGSVYIFGAGHVGRELEPLLSRVGFRCVVLDDRPEFADRQLFPTAAAVICGDLSKLSDYVNLGPEDYACIMTRGHEHDLGVLAQVLAAGPRYVGLMGSRKKIAAVHRTLEEKYGFTPEQIAHVTAPIGLEIGAQTPSEIAVSVAAQLIAERAKDHMA